MGLVPTGACENTWSKGGTEIDTGTGTGMDTSTTLWHKQILKNLGVNLGMHKHGELDWVKFLCSLVLLKLELDRI